MISLTRELPARTRLPVKTTPHGSLRARAKALVVRLITRKELSRDDLERIMQAHAQRDEARRRTDHLLALEARRF